MCAAPVCAPAVEEAEAAHLASSKNCTSFANRLAASTDLVKHSMDEAEGAALAIAVAVMEATEVEGVEVGRRECSR